MHADGLESHMIGHALPDTKSNHTTKHEEPRPLMEFAILCQCGLRIAVQSTQTGSDVVRCDCGRLNRIPSLAELRRQATTSNLPTAQATIPSSTPSPGPERRQGFVRLLTDEATVRERMDISALMPLITTLLGEIKGHARSANVVSGIDLYMGFAILPQGRRLMDIQVQPKEGVAFDLSTLRDRLQALPLPAVEKGPVAVAIFEPVAGGTGSPRSFASPFAQLLQGCNGSFEERLMSAAGLTVPSPKTTWRIRIRTLTKTFLAGCRKIFLDFPDTPSDQLMQSCGNCRACTIEDIQRRLRQFPRRASLHRCAGDVYARAGKCADAITHYSKFLELLPSDLEVRLRRADMYRQGGQTALALAEYTRAITMDPASGWARNNRGVLYEALGALEQSLADLTMACRLLPRSSLACRNRGRVLARLHRWHEAVDEFNDALRMNPYDDEVYRLRAQARRWRAPSMPEPQRELRLAIADLDEAIRRNGRFANDRVLRGELHLMIGQVSAALADGEEALRLDPESAGGYAIRGLSRFHSDQADTAISDCTEAIQRGIRSSQLFASRGVAWFRQQEPELALADLDQAVQIDPQDATACFWRALVHRAQGALPQAIEDLAQAIRINPSAPNMYLARSEIYLDQHDYERALEDAEAALRLDPHLGQAYHTRACIFASQGQYRRALADFDEAIRLNPDKAIAWLQRAQIHTQQNDPEKALADVTKAIRLDPDLAAAYHCRGQLYLQLQELDRAMADFDRLIELCPSLAAAYTGRGLVWIERGQEERASHDFQEAIQLEPSMAESFHLQRLLAEAAYYHRQENFHEAIARAAEAIHQEPDCAPAYAIRAAAYWYSEHFVEAVDDYSRQLELDDDSYHALSGRGQVYVELGKFEKALENLDQALKLGQGSQSPAVLAYALSGRALAHFGLGHQDAANRDFEESIVNCPANAWVHYNHGLMYHHLAQPEKAAKCFELALNLSAPALSPRKRARAEAALQRWKRNDMHTELKE